MLKNEGRWLTGQQPSQKTRGVNYLADLSGTAFTLGTALCAGMLGWPFVGVPAGLAAGLLFTVFAPLWVAGAVLPAFCAVFVCAKDKPVKTSIVPIIKLNFFMAVLLSIR